MADSNEYAGIKTGSMEYVKQHLTYDGSNRLQYVYEAKANTGNGGYALITKYQYDGTSTRVSDMKEYSGTWNSAWDF